MKLVSDWCCGSPCPVSLMETVEMELMKMNRTLPTNFFQQ